MVQVIFYFFFLINFVYLFMFVCAGASLLCTWFSCIEQGLLYLQCMGVSLWWLLFLQSTCSEPVGFGSCIRGLSSCCSQTLEYRLSSCNTWAYLPFGKWDLPGPRIKPMFALAGGFFTTEAPGNPIFYFLNWVLRSGVFTLLFAMYYYVWLKYFVIKNLKIL